MKNMKNMKFINFLSMRSFTDTVYMRKLPKRLIAFSSEYGKKIFKEALLDGTMESYFPLSE